MTIEPEAGLAWDGPDERPEFGGQHGAKERVQEGARGDAGLGPDALSSGDTDDGAATAAPTAFEGPSEFARALRHLLRQAVEDRASRLCWCDPDFAAWPLGDTAWLDALTQWARLGGRELVMVAGHYGAIERFHPRFVNWRAGWAHAIQCLLPDEARTIPLPTLWTGDSRRVLRVFDVEHWRGRVSGDRVDRQCAREDFDAISQRASPGFSAVTLGL